MNHRHVVCGQVHEPDTLCPEPTLSQDVLEAVPAWGVALRETQSANIERFNDLEERVEDHNERLNELENIPTETLLGLLKERVAALEANVDTLIEWSNADDMPVAEPEPYPQEDE